MTYNYSITAARLKAARKEFGYSLEQVAEFCGVQQYQTVSKWESGNSTPSVEKLMRLCDLYGYEIGYFMGEYDCKTRARTDIHEFTGLAEKAISQLNTDRAFNPDRIRALNEILIYNSGDIIQLIADSLYYRFDGQIAVGDRTINGKNLNDLYLLEIASELRALRKSIIDSE